MKKNSITPDRFIGEAIVQAQLRSNRLDSQELKMYAMVRNDFTEMGVRIADVEPIDESVVLAKDTTVEDEMDATLARPARTPVVDPSAPAAQQPRTELLAVVGAAQAFGVEQLAVVGSHVRDRLLGTQDETSNTYQVRNHLRGPAIGGME